MRLTEEQFAAIAASRTKATAVKIVVGASFTVFGDPIGKPRQTRADKWKKRPAVMRYREWADKARDAASPLPASPARVTAIAFLAIPASWSKKKRAEHAGKPHRAKPDADNILKSVCDALFEEDSMIYEKHISKFWDDGNGPRVEIAVAGD